VKLKLPAHRTGVPADPGRPVRDDGAVPTVPDPDGPRSPVESVDRALQLLDALAAAGPRGATLADLTRGTGLSKATVHRSLAALRFRSFADQDPASGAYVLGAAAVRLGDAYDANESLAQSLHPALVALSTETGELVHLGVLVGAEVVYLDKVEPERAVRVVSAVGRRNPAVTTALGRALLAARGTSEAGLGGYVRAAEVIRGPVDARRVAGAVSDAVRRGWAMEDEENEPGIACVAVAVLRGPTPVAALSVTAPAERMSSARVGELVERIGVVVPPLLPDGYTLGTTG
jgi:DNA-binding IclR family transcriptional regulator